MGITLSIRYRDIKISHLDPVVRKLRFDDHPPSTRAPQPRPKNPFIDDSAIESDGEGGNIESTPSSPDTSPRPARVEPKIQVFDRTSVIRGPTLRIVPKGTVLPSKPFLPPFPKRSLVVTKIPVFPRPNPIVKPVRRTKKICLRSILPPADRILKPARKSVVAQVQKISCDLCGSTLSGPKQLAQHRGGKKCKNRLERKSVPTCTVCKRTFDTKHNLDKQFTSKQK